MVVGVKMINNIDIRMFSATVNTVKANPKKGATVCTARTRWKGGLKSEAKVRNFTLSFDEPEAVAGADSAANPHETLLACYGASLTVGLSLNAALKGISIYRASSGLQALKV